MIEGIKYYHDPNGLRQFHTIVQVLVNNFSDEQKYLLKDLWKRFDWQQKTIRTANKILYGSESAPSTLTEMRRKMFISENTAFKDNMYLSNNLDNTNDLTRLYEAEDSSLAITRVPDPNELVTAYLYQFKQINQLFITPISMSHSWLQMRAVKQKRRHFQHTTR